MNTESVLNGFELFYEYQNDEDMAQHKAWIRKVAAERRDLIKWAESQLLIAWISLTARRPKR